MFAQVPSPWVEIPYIKNGQKVARALCCGTEIHFEIAPGHEHKVIFRHVTREFLKPMFDKHGLLTTKTWIGDEVNARFITRLGFEKTWSDAEYDYYILTALPFEKKGT